MSCAINSCVWVPSALALIKTDAKDWMASIIPTPPQSVRVQYCAVCGALRLAPHTLAEGVPS